MMQALYTIAKQSNDHETMELVRQAFDKYCLNLDIQRVDQSVYGTVAIYLFKEYGGGKYKDYAEKVYNYLKNKNTKEYGIRFLDNYSTSNHVDGIGVFNPFLVTYAKEFNVSEAYSIALQNFELYTKYGVDEWGRPSQLYNTIPPYERTGRPNWGRGFAWYALGAISLNEEDMTEDCKAKLQNFKDYIVSVWERDHKFTHFINKATDDIDLSATLPLLYYMYTNSLIALTEDELLQLSTFMVDGIMYHSSGVLMNNREYQFASSQRLSQAFMLNLISAYKSGKYKHEHSL